MDTPTSVKFLQHNSILATSAELSFLLNDLVFHLCLQFTKTPYVYANLYVDGIVPVKSVHYLVFIQRNIFLDSIIYYYIKVYKANE